MTRSTKIVKNGSKGKRRVQMVKDEVLIKKALEAREKAYAPYSKFKVGAALLDKNGKIHQGCNIENAAYTPTNCAERTAVFKAVSEGVKEFDAIAIVGGPEKQEDGGADYCMPCGVCRQVLAEFCDSKEFRVLIAKSEGDYKEYLLDELLPFRFTKNMLSDEEEI